MLLYNNNFSCCDFWDLTIIGGVTFVIVINTYKHITFVKNICFTKIKFVSL